MMGYQLQGSDRRLACVCLGPLRLITMQRYLAVIAVPSITHYMQAVADNAELAKRNTRLIEESEALLMRCQANGDAPAPAPAPSSPSAKKSKNRFFAFRK